MHAWMQKDPRVFGKAGIMIQLRRAKINESVQILEFYKNIINTTNDEFNPKWNDDYPNLEFIENSISKGELYIYKTDGKIISSIVVNTDFDERYNGSNWIANAESDEIVVIHTFAIDPNCRGQGIGKEIVNTIKMHSLKNHKKTIRIDIINGNNGAESVFKHLGFEYVDTVEVFHDQVGLEKFHLYEFVLKWKMGF